MAENESAEATRSHEFYFDDFEVGHALQMGTYTVTEEEILTFALQHDPQPFHIDAEAAKYSIYGGIISSDWITCSIMMRLMVTNFFGKAASMDSPGMGEIRWMKSVYPGDTLSMSSTCMEVCPSQSKSNRGVAVNRWGARNQRDKLVCTAMDIGLFSRRPKA